MKIFLAMVKNPGIPYDNPLVAKARNCIFNLDRSGLAHQSLNVQSVGITGTNGKTTTTMIGPLLNQERTAGKAHLAGSIGFPAVKWSVKQQLKMA